MNQLPPALSGIIMLALLLLFMGSMMQQVSIDSLTQVNNRQNLLEFMTQKLKSHNKDLYLLMMDMDDFKRINDTHGHEEGDRVLREVGKLLSDTFGKEYCYRYGGDEFLLIVPDISISEFNEKLGTLEPNGPAIDDTARAGFSVGFVRAMLTDSDMLRNLIARADEKMYESKREKNCVS
jgi:diguanylate cyclase (GGDEF)-like protein